MKNLVKVLMIFAIVALLASCGDKTGKKDKYKQETPTATPQATPQATPNATPNATPTAIPQRVPSVVKAPDMKPNLVPYARPQAKPGKVPALRNGKKNKYDEFTVELAKKDPELAADVIAELQEQLTLADAVYMCYIEGEHVHSCQLGQGERHKDLK